MAKTQTYQKKVQSKMAKTRTFLPRGFSVSRFITDTGYLPNSSTASTIARIFSAGTSSMMVCTDAIM